MTIQQLHLGATGSQTEGMKWASEWFRAPGTVTWLWLTRCCARQTPQTSQRRQDKCKYIKSNSPFHPRGLEKNLPKAGGGLEKFQLCPGPLSPLMQSSLWWGQNIEGSVIPSPPFKYWKLVPSLQDHQLQQKTDYVSSLQKSKADFEAEFKSPDSHCFVVNKYVPFVAGIRGKKITSSPFKHNTLRIFVWNIIYIRK